MHMQACTHGCTQSVSSKDMEPPAVRGDLHFYKPVANPALAAFKEKEENE